ncbi:MAG: hypothetical protein M0C28_33390 [Candidatus Moduliflexus flocculans]|nr:hypothetical protein [Candidatus Moduliflexus flocculans]
MNGFGAVMHRHRHGRLRGDQVQRGRLGRGHHHPASCCDVRRDPSPLQATWHRPPLAR